MQVPFVAEALCPVSEKDLRLAGAISLAFDCVSVVAYVIILGWTYVCSTYRKTSSKHCMAPVSRKGTIFWRKLRARLCTHVYVHIRTCIRTCIRMLLKSRIAYLAWASWQHDCHVQLSFGCDQSWQNIAFFLRQNRASSAQALRKATCLWRQGNFCI